MLAGTALLFALLVPIPWETALDRTLRQKYESIAPTATLGQVQDVLDKIPQPIERTGDWVRFEYPDPEDAISLTWMTDNLRVVFFADPGNLDHVIGRSISRCSEPESLLERPFRHPLHRGLVGFGGRCLFVVGLGLSIIGIGQLLGGRYAAIANCGCALYSILVVIGLVIEIRFSNERNQSNPIQARRPNAEIQAEILADTPLGTEFEKVQVYVKRRWGKKVEPYQHVQAPGKDCWGKKLNADYGRYTNGPFDLLPTEVMISWYFNENDRLEDVEVSKFARGP
jgi:hypothetical protein